MFKYCLWLVVNDPKVIEQNKKIAQLLNTKPFIPHITINHTMPTPMFYSGIHRPNNIYFVDQPTASTSFVYDEDNKLRSFHAIEQKVYVPYFKDVDAHLSLAYRVDGEPFTLQDLMRIPILGLDLINYKVRKKNLKIKNANCWDDNPEKWYIII
tara:strand:- start:1243 stop:1704 length:462 start_codon:yes stop_codon:yes gene_type:complete